MAKINTLYLSNFRNFDHSEINFNEKVNILYGLNGSGKTNILESISLLGKGRGFRNDKIVNLINKNNNNFIIQSSFNVKNIIYDIKVTSNKLNERLKKISYLNGENSKDTNSFINSIFSFIIFLPEMERLFQSSPSNRRNFIDKLIFSENSNYNSLINRYKRNILERTKLLQISNFDENWISKIEEYISIDSLEIYKLRKKQIHIISEEIEKIQSLKDFKYKAILKIDDETYDDTLTKDKLLHMLKKNRLYDKIHGGCKIGPQKSNFHAIIDQDFSASQLSTGQQKTLVILILIAQCNHLINNKNYQPILLLDEICSHLDNMNRSLILELLEKYDIQTFMTGTDKSLFSFISTNAKFYNITGL